MNTNIAKGFSLHTPAAVRFMHSKDSTQECPLCVSIRWFNGAVYLHVSVRQATGSFKTSAHFYHTTWHHIPKYSNLYGHRCKNLKSHIFTPSSLLQKEFVGMDVYIQELLVF